MTDPLRDGDLSQVGPFQLHGRLGGGGMGEVYLGRSPGGHTVAVKVVRRELAGDADFRRRFASEVAAARRVGGFYTAHLVDADPDGSPPWLATSYIAGPTLQQAVADHGPFPAASVSVLGAGLAEGLAAVHAAGVVHRDLKPANVILTADGPRLIDFGIARALDATSHTRTSTVLGTAAYMSPEQARGEDVGPPADVFALGCVLAFAATGRSPFGEGPAHAVAYRIVHADPDLSCLPDGLDALVSACLAKDPDARPGPERILERLTAADAPAYGHGHGHGHGQGKGLGQGQGQGQDHDRDHDHDHDPGHDGGQNRGSWLPHAVTEAVTLHETRVRTLVAPAPAPPTPPAGPSVSVPAQAPMGSSGQRSARWKGARLVAVLPVLTVTAPTALAVGTDVISDWWDRARYRALDTSDCAGEVDGTLFEVPCESDTAEYQVTLVHSWPQDSTRPSNPDESCAEHADGWVRVVEALDHNACLVPHP
ncbi:serine/threonine-protein kinase [Nocardiopsis aegyptia]|uniref:serine/threonine-protein kinase n=1 Tax=Nocardiopsis aegyptia TaxID=220378 RepID=UPI0036729C84